MATLSKVSTLHHCILSRRERTSRIWGLRNEVHIRQGNYHDLSIFLNDHFDGVYTMETFVHADDPARTLHQFHQKLKPGGVLVMHEAECKSDAKVPQRLLQLSHCPNTRDSGASRRMEEEAGFDIVGEEDLTQEVKPLWRLFGLVAIVPYKIISMVRLEKRFTNMMAAAEAFRHWDAGKYISIEAIKRR